MTDLVDLAINAHGGLSRWNEVRELAVQVSLTGPMYVIKGQPQGMANVSMHVDTRVPAIDVSPFPAAGHVGHFRPDRTFVSDGTGKLTDERDRPRETFAGHILSSRWTRPSSSISMPMRCGTIFRRRSCSPAPASS